MAEEAEVAGKPDPSGAGTFERLMDTPAAQGAAAGTPPAAGAPDAMGTPDASAAPVTTQETQPTAQAVEPAEATVGDRILAAMGTAPTGNAGAVAPVTARPGIDIGDPMDSLHVQLRVAELKAEVGLAADVVQKSSQGMDTLLKSQ
ncbi:MAG: hypothetical protein OXH68_12185 [Gammaproteobacteria bacterium]|nr:hypothetical protein [Gammaproteobacteria bacterium]